MKVGACFFKFMWGLGLKKCMNFLCMLKGMFLLLFLLMKLMFWVRLGEGIGVMRERLCLISF